MNLERTVACASSLTQYDILVTRYFRVFSSVIDLTCFERSHSAEVSRILRSRGPSFAPPYPPCGAGVAAKKGLDFGTQLPQYTGARHVALNEEGDRPKLLNYFSVCPAHRDLSREHDARTNTRG